MASAEFSFSTFSKNAFYGELNARLVDMTDVADGQRIVDLACGTGGVTRLILERIIDARNSVIIAMDQSAAALKQAMEDLKDIRDNAVQFVNSRVELVSEALKERVDTVILCNAIHYISDKDSLVTEISKALKPGGSSPSTPHSTRAVSTPSRSSSTANGCSRVRASCARISASRPTNRPKFSPESI